MEHYKKKQSHYYEDPCGVNELRITGTGKSHDLCTKVTHRLKDSPTEGVVVSASGNHVTKAVTVVELLKRKLPGVHQHTEIKWVRVEDVWEPDQEGLDPLKVTRHIPAISMHLTKPSPDDPPQSRHGDPPEGDSRERTSGRTRRDHL